MRKKLLAVALIICLVLTILPIGASALNDDDKRTLFTSLIASEKLDTSWYTDNPDATEFHISTPAQLWGLNYFGFWQYYVSFEGKTVYIDADIDLAGFPNWVAPYTHTSTYAFKGTLDGQNHVIFNLKGETFFGAVISGSTLKNICISGAEIGGSTILASQLAVNGVIDNCIVSGSVSGGNNVAAISGLTGGTVTNCISMATLTANTNSGAGGLVYNANNKSGLIANNIVLNYSVQSKYPAGDKIHDYLGRVVGVNDVTSPLSNNVAWDGTLVLDVNGNQREITSNPAGIHGQSVSLAEIYANGYLDRLPASFPIPLYLAQPAPDPVNMLTVNGAQGVDLGSADFSFDALLQLNNVNLIEAEFSYDASKFSIEAVAVPAGLTVKKIDVWGADNKVVVVLGVQGKDGAFAPDELSSLVSFKVRAIDGKPETATLTLVSATLYSKGVIVDYDVVNQSATVTLNYHVPNDVNDDGVVDAADLSIALYYFGASEEDADWADAASSDVNGDGVVDMLDITILVEAIYG